MNKLTRKQFLKRKTLWIASEIYKNLLPESEAGNLTLKEVVEKFPKVNHLRDNSTGEIRVGLSLRGIRKLVKKYPEITVDQVRYMFNMDPA